MDYEERKKQEAAALLQEGEAALSSSTTSITSSSAEPDWITDFVQKKAERDLVSKLKVRVSACFRLSDFFTLIQWMFVCFRMKS